MSSPEQRLALKESRQKYWTNLKKKDPERAKRYMNSWWERNRGTWVAKTKCAIKNPIDTFNTESSYKVSFEGTDDCTDDVNFLEALSKKNSPKN